MTLDPGSAIARTPRGEEIDGQRMLRQAVGFGRALRRAGLATDLGAAQDFARALEIVDMGDRAQVKAAGAAVFIRRRDDRPMYDLVFDRYWRRRGTWPGDPPAATRPEPMDTDEEAGEDGENEPGVGDERVKARADVGQPLASKDDDDATDEEAVDGVTIAPDAFSATEVIRHREFDRMTPAELRDAERLVDLLTPRLELRRTRRYELHPHGRRLAPRAMFRRNMSTGGQMMDWVWRRPVRRPRPIVVICDISGSMERHSRLLLRFIQALAASSDVRTEAFVFGTRLTRVTRLLRDKDRDRALARVAEAVNDWAGGTRIGESFREFNLRWARRSLRTSGVVIVISDGWDRGDPAIVAEETARLRRNCHRLVWLNPLAGTFGYQPLAAGMKAAFPYIDDFLPAGTVASLERLGQILAGVRTQDTGRHAEIAAHAMPHLAASSGASTAPEPMPSATDPSAARRLR